MIIAARDEEATLPETLRSLRGIPNLSHLIVADDSSTDATARVSSDLGAQVVRSPGTDGKGGALLCGLAHARRLSPGAVLLADADLGASAANLAALLAVLDDEHPVAIAAFPKSAASGGGFGLVKGFARRSIARRTGFTPLEPLSGQRALVASTLDSLPGIAPGFGAEVGMTLDLLAACITPLEVPVELSHRPTGRSLAGFAHRARQGLDIAKALRGERLKW